MTPGPGFIRGSKLPQLLVSVLLLGIADSMIGPYLVLFGADEAQLSPLQVGVFMSVIALSGLAVSTWLGRRYDRSASRAPRSSARAWRRSRSCSRWPVRISTCRPAVRRAGNARAAVGVVAGLGHRSPDGRGRARLAGIPGLMALTA
jgi:hypothetical protein